MESWRKRRTVNKKHEDDRSVDDLAQKLSVRKKHIAELNQFLGFIARELDDKKWNELIDKFDQWRKEEDIK